MDADSSSRATALKGPRPKYLDITQIRQPLPAIASILHRISGFGLFLAIPFLLYAFQLSVTSPETFDSWRAIFGNPLVKLVMIGLLWAFFHHVFAGIRFLLLDLHIGLELQRTRAASGFVIVAGIACALIFGALLW